MGEIINQTTLNFANLHQVLRRGLDSDHPDLTDTRRCTLYFNSYARISGHGATVLLDCIPEILPRPPNHHLEALFIIEAFKSFQYRPTVDAQRMIDEGSYHLTHLNDPNLECKRTISLGGPRLMNFSVISHRGWALSSCE